MASYSPVQARIVGRSRCDAEGLAEGKGEASGATGMLRVAGALALLAVGALHLQQYLGGGYSSVPTIGTLFLLNFVGALVIALGLLVPLERLLPRFGAAAVSVLPLAGVAMAAVSIVFC